MAETLTKSYTLHYPHSNEWLAQVLISDDGMVAVCSNYGNFAFAWRSSAKTEGIRELLLRTDPGYFADKIAIGLAPLQPGKRSATYLLQAAKHILPVLQDALRAEAESASPIMYYGQRSNGILMTPCAVTDFMVGSASCAECAHFVRKIPGEKQIVCRAAEKTGALIAGPVETGDTGDTRDTREGGEDA